MAVLFRYCTCLFLSVPLLLLFHMRLFCVLQSPVCCALSSAVPGVTCLCAHFPPFPRLPNTRGVAKFEQFCAEHDIDVPFESISQLYEDPSNLAALPDNKTKLLARSIIQQSVDERYCSIYFECTTTAKELAHTGLKDVIPDSAGKVGGVIKDILPLPGFLKKG
eukprot:GHRR01008185.1.p1 GENE.GHRR01008185.1~~GHRR01008185.1.p1  ORF type:complete len:164 (+),score=21.48 GHRR01008185.1:817-1308(+)